jgi:hypothetical protein
MKQNCAKRDKVAHIFSIRKQTIWLVWCYFEVEKELLTALDSQFMILRLGFEIF